jgi:hypothetical protein
VAAISLNFYFIYTSYQGCRLYTPDIWTWQNELLEVGMENFLKSLKRETHSHEPRGWLPHKRFIPLPLSIVLAAETLPKPVQQATLTAACTPVCLCITSPQACTSSPSTSVTYFDAVTLQEKMSGLVLGASFLGSPR